MKLRPKAFSLIELSIVIVIVGTLVAGVSRSSRVAYEGRLQAARGLTRGAAVVSIKGLALWFETSLEDSFLASQAEDDEPITIWHDINPQVPYNLFALKSATDGAVYVEKGINGLPSIELSGSEGDSAFRLSAQKNPAVMKNSAVDTPGNEYTFFIVAESDALSNTRNSIFVNGNYASNSSSYYVTGLGAKALGFKTPTTEEFFTTAGGVDSKHPDITSGTYKEGTAKLYVNGIEKISETITELEIMNIKEFTIGSHDFNDTNPDTNNYWNGVLSEFIYFDRKLSDVQRKDVEKYLSKKYYITVQ